MGGRTRLLTIADGKSNMNSLETLLSERFDVLGVSAGSLLNKIRRYNPDAAVVDVISEPGNVNFIKRINNRFSELPVIAVIPDSSDQLEVYRHSLPCVCAGARGVVAMNGSCEQTYYEIVTALSELANGRNYPKKSGLWRQMEIIKSYTSNFNELSPAEKKVLKLGVDCSLTYKGIGGRLNRSAKTIGIHLTRIYRKLGLSGRYDMLFCGALDLMGYFGKGFLDLSPDELINEKILENFYGNLSKLSPCRREVFLLTLGGLLSKKETAYERHRSKRTVEVQLSQVYSRFGFSGIEEMIFYGLLYALGHAGKKTDFER